MISVKNLFDNDDAVVINFKRNEKRSANPWTVSECMSQRISASVKTV